MEDKEVIDIFERIWHADIINKHEPLYSVAISVAENWTPPGNIGLGGEIPLHRKLLQRLLDHWEDTLTRHMDNVTMGAPFPNGISVFFRDIREKYKDSRVLTSIVNKIIRKITDGVDN